jgi:hypothetical protein
LRVGFEKMATRKKTDSAFEAGFVSNGRTGTFLDLLRCMEKGISRGFLPELLF